MCVLGTGGAEGGLLPKRPDTDGALAVGTGERLGVRGFSDGQGEDCVGLGPWGG